MPRKAPAKKAPAKKAVSLKKDDTPSQKDRDNYIAAMKKGGILGDIHKKIDLISTGSWVINRLIGDGTHTDAPGGVPRGFFTEICGDESTGKTTLALHIAKQVLLAGEPVVYADFEHSLRLQLSYVKNIGIDTNSPNFIHITPNSLQEGTSAIGKALVMVKPSVIIIDSVAAMLPQETLDKDANETMAIGKHAKLVGSFINWIGKKLR